MGEGKKKKSLDVTYKSIATLPAKHLLSEESLARNGVVRTLPIVVNDDELRNKQEVASRAVSELASSATLSNEQSYEIMPLFHLDQGDEVDLPMGVGRVTFNQAPTPTGFD